jgi:hypothetical protein
LRHRRLALATHCGVESLRASGALVELRAKPRGDTKTRRIYAYLRYSVAGKTLTLYVGDATADCREDALQLAWSTVHKRKLLNS